MLIVFIFNVGAPPTVGHIKSFANMGRCQAAMQEANKVRPDKAWLTCVPVHDIGKFA